MKAKELADKLNGIEYGDRILEEHIQFAKDNDLVIVTGYSDDNVEFEGAVYEEVSAYGGGNIPLAKDGEPIFGCDEPCEHCRNIDDGDNAKYKIEAKWNFEGYSWFIDINLESDKYAVFQVMEDGETFCRGIVFDKKDLI